MLSRNVKWQWLTYAFSRLAYLFSVCIYIHWEDTLIAVDKSRSHVERSTPSRHFALPAGLSATAQQRTALVHMPRHRAAAMPPCSHVVPGASIERSPSTASTL